MNVVNYREAMDAPPTRTYRSPLRAERAAQTRARVRAAARELFEAEGFGSTTIAAISERADVSPQTIYSTFGSKAAILRDLLEQMEEAAEAVTWRERIAQEQDPALVLRAFAQWTRAFFATSRASMQVAQAAMADPLIAELAETGNQRRRQALTSLMGRLADEGVLRPGLERDEAVDRAWLLTGVETYLGATAGCGWSEERYADWLAESLTLQLLATPPSDPPTLSS